MCDEDERLPLVAEELSEEPKNLLSGVGVQISRRLVRQHDCRVVDQGAGDCHALLLAAGELVRKRPGTIRKTYATEECRHLRVAGGLTDVIELQRQGQVLSGRKRRNQIVELVDKPDVTPPKEGKVRLAETGHDSAQNAHFSDVRPVDPREEVE